MNSIEIILFIILIIAALTVYIHHRIVKYEIYRDRKLDYQEDLEDGRIMPDISNVKK